MIRLKRLLLIFVVALAVPLQGTAAIAAGICMPFGHHDAPAAQAHDYAQQGGVADSQGAADTDQGGAHCGPCVACCGTAASIAPAFDLSASVPTGARVEAHPAAEPARMLSGVLDRPPLAL